MKADWFGSSPVKEGEFLVYKTPNFIMRFLSLRSWTGNASLVWEATEYNLERGRAISMLNGCLCVFSPDDASSLAAIKLYRPGKRHQGRHLILSVRSDQISDLDFCWFAWSPLIALYTLDPNWFWIAQVILPSYHVRLYGLWVSVAIWQFAASIDEALLWFDSRGCLYSITLLRTLVLSA